MTNLEVFRWNEMEVEWRYLGSPFFCVRFLVQILGPKIGCKVNSEAFSVKLPQWCMGVLAVVYKCKIADGGSREIDVQSERTCKANNEEPDSLYKLRWMPTC